MTRMIAMDISKECEAITGDFSKTGTNAIYTRDVGVGTRIASKIKSYVDLDLECTVDCVAFNGDARNATVGLMARYVDRNNYYLFIFEASVFSIVRKLRGVFTILSSTPVKPQQSYNGVYRAFLAGPVLQFYKDGDLLGTALDSSIAKGGFGFVNFCTNTTFANAKLAAAMESHDMSITQFEPATAVAGDTVTIRGTALDCVQRVTFNGVSAPNFGKVSDTVMTAVVPQNCGTGNISVYAAATSAGVFVEKQPTPPPPPPVPVPVPLFELSGDKGVEPAELENDQNTDWAFAITADPLDAARKCYRFECRKSTPPIDGSQRSELKLYRDVFKMQLRKDYYFGFKVLLDKSWVTGGDRWCVLFQIHEIPDHITSTGQQDEPWRSPPLALMAINNKFKWIYRSDPQPISTDAGSEKWDSMTLGGPKDAYGWQGQVDKDEPNWFSCPLVIGKWVEWKVHMKWDWTSGGILQIWKDGELVVDRVNQPIGYNDEVGGTVKWGIYRSAPDAFAPYQDRVVYHNDITVSETI